MRQLAQEEWGHFLVRVKQTDQGTVWVVEAVDTGETATLQSMEQIVAFIQTHLKPTAQLRAPRRTLKP